MASRKVAVIVGSLRKVGSGGAGCAFSNAAFATLSILGTGTPLTMVGS